jgi:hypothetical protein|tara:strand:- start:54 stop:479 length:426 start_codon:yes stop_codon:yes gene_type:complete
MNTIKDLKKEIRDVKYKIANAEDKPGKGNKRLGSVAGIKNRWQPGNDGYGGGKAAKVRLRFWKYVKCFLDMQMVEVEEIDEDTLTLGQLGAKKFSLAVADGRWVQTKEVIDRELGKYSEGGDEEEEDKPRVIKMPFRVNGN